ncbi:MAG: glycosyltransferase [Chitinophaga sp.]|uniref:glycosyltransferase n=1 Tax=Chitinophaga sp. TaxID=1869181 RepID=UPI0025C5A29F|nr:glycosyltransferase [Chitinophaga sp.]MBV8254345.1 glycosyltransferase [Chitinophaga sp.]
MRIESTVLMSLFWKENPVYLDQALESLYHQTQLPDEILLVCEGDIPPPLMAIVNKWKQKFAPDVIRTIPADDAKGLPACLNKGIYAARGKYIFRFDTDDICTPDRMEKQLAYFHQHPDVVLLSAPAEEYDMEMKERLGVRDVPVSHKAILKRAKWRSPFSHTVAAYSREVAIELGGYPLVTAAEDYAFFALFLVKGYKTDNIPDILAKARAGKDFARRRKGMKFLKGELASLAYMHKIGLYSKPLYYFHVVSKSVIRNLPSGVLVSIYKNFLRKQ